MWIYKHTHRKTRVWKILEHIYTWLSMPLEGFMCSLRNQISRGPMFQSNIFLSMCHHRFADTTQISRRHFFFIRRWRTRKINRKTNTHIPSLKNAARTKVINCCTIFYHLHPTSETLFASSIQKHWCLPTITSLLQLPKHSKSFPTRTRTTISSSKAPVPLFISGCWMYKTEVENHPNNIIEIHNNVFVGLTSFNGIF